MKRTLLWLLAAALFLIGFLFYHFRSGNGLNVEPHAREVIEKAQQH